MGVLPANLASLRLESGLWALHCTLDLRIRVLGSVLDYEICHLGAGLDGALGSGSAIYWCCADLLSLLPLALGLGSLSVEFLTLGQLLTCPLLEFADQINQVGPTRGREVVQASVC